MLVSFKRLCIMRWLPRVLAARNPFCSRIRQISLPERTRSLPNQYLDLSHEHLVVRSACNFRGVGCLKEQRESFYQICSRLFNGCTLTRNIELRTQCDKTIVL